MPHAGKDLPSLVNRSMYLHLLFSFDFLRYYKSSVMYVIPVHVKHLFNGTELLWRDIVVANEKRLCAKSSQNKHRNL